MPRVKRGTIANKKREKTLKLVKDFRFGHKTKDLAAKEALLHAMASTFRSRKEKKRDFRRLWSVKLNAAVRPEGTTYSKFIAALKKKNIALDRKILADLAEHEPNVFKKIVAAVK
jgi:large subunit ribosomal protein L20